MTSTGTSSPMSSLLGKGPQQLVSELLGSAPEAHREASSSNHGDRRSSPKVNRRMTEDPHLRSHQYGWGSQYGYGCTPAMEPPPSPAPPPPPSPPPEPYGMTFVPPSMFYASPPMDQFPQTYMNSSTTSWYYPSSQSLPTMILQPSQREYLSRLLPPYNEREVFGKMPVRKEALQQYPMLPQLYSTTLLSPQPYPTPLYSPQPQNLTLSQLYTNLPSTCYHQSLQQHPSIPYSPVEPSLTLPQQYETPLPLIQSPQPPYPSLQQQEQSEPKVFDDMPVRKLGSMSWCRRCKIDCMTMEELVLHSLTSEHQNLTMALVLNIRQNIGKEHSKSEKGHESFGTKEVIEDSLVVEKENSYTVNSSLTECKHEVENFDGLESSINKDNEECNASTEEISIYNNMKAFKSPPAMTLGFNPLDRECLKCEIKKEIGSNLDFSVVVDHVFFCEYSYDPVKGADKQLPANVKIFSAILYNLMQKSFPGWSLGQLQDKAPAVATHVDHSTKEKLVITIWDPGHSDHD